jgi:hypothetical protein
VYGQVTAGQSGDRTVPSVNFAPSGGAGVTQHIPAGALLSPVEFAG